MVREISTANCTHRIALVAPNLPDSGGVQSVTRFLLQTIEDSEDFSCELFSLASSATDLASLRIVSPKSWLDKPTVESIWWEGREVRHVGACFVEFEFQRYRPRGVLSKALQEFDIVQMVAGSPAHALTAKYFEGPVVLQVATMAAVERKERFRSEAGLVTAWRRLMTRVTTHFDRKGLCVADRILVENHWMKSEVAKWTDSDKAVLAPPGVDTNAFHPSPSRPESNFGHILSVGRFDDRRKNVRLLFEAYAEVCAGCDDPPLLVLAGKSGPRLEDWERAKELGIRERVVFHEKVDRPRLAELYRNALLFVLSSAEEGLGIVILEAMASGLPVVSTATAGAREAVEQGKSGILTPVGDATELSRAIRRLLADSNLRRDMAEAARKRAEVRYSHDAAGRRFLSQYRELLGLGDPES